MLKLKIGDKELNVKYAYEPTLKCRVLSRMVKKESEKESKNEIEAMEATEELLLFLPEMLLVGLQKFHSDEYGFDWETGEGKEEQVSKMFTLIEEYFDSNDKEDAITFYNALSEEMLSDGFLRSQFQRELKKAKNK